MVGPNVGRVFSALAILDSSLACEGGFGYSFSACSRISKFGMMLLTGLFVADLAISFNWLNKRSVCSAFVDRSGTILISRRTCAMR